MRKKRGKSYLLDIVNLCVDDDCNEKNGGANTAHSQLWGIREERDEREREEVRRLNMSKNINLYEKGNSFTFILAIGDSPSSFRQGLDSNCPPPLLLLG